MFGFKQKQMAATLDDVLSLAKSTHALSQEQLSRILALAPTMGAADLENMKSMLMEVREKELGANRKKLATYKAAAAASTEWSAGQNRQKREKEEAAEILQDAATADHLLSNV